MLYHIHHMRIYRQLTHTHIPLHSNSKNYTEPSTSLILIYMCISYHEMHSAYSLYTCSRIWFWVKDASDDTSSHFNWSRDSIYGATILLGIGGATIIVLSLTMISQLVGKYAVSVVYR